MISYEIWWLIFTISEANMWNIFYFNINISVNLKFNAWVLFCSYLLTHEIIKRVIIIDENVRVMENMLFLHSKWFIIAILMKFVFMLMKIDSLSSKHFIIIYLQLVCTHILLGRKIKLNATII